MRVVGVVDDVRTTSPDREASSEVFVEYLDSNLSRMRLAKRNLKGRSEAQPRENSGTRDAAAST
jgi:hypothetical protein